MSKEVAVGCAVKPKPKPTAQPDVTPVQELPKEERNMVMVGQKAPDFTTGAYHNGKFIETSLSDYAGKWVLLCFYPGDFTFV